MPRLLLLLSAAWLLPLAATAGEPVTPDDVEGPFAWGSASRVTHLGHLWFADQPDAAGFEAARDAGVRLVIDLRDPSERSWQEQPVVEDLGMTYHNVPIRGVAGMTAENVSRIDEIVEQHHGDSVLIHCSSSNRVGGWLASHLVTHHSMSVDDAITVANRAGLTKPGLIDAVRALLTSDPTRD